MRVSRSVLFDTAQPNQAQPMAEADPGPAHRPTHCRPGPVHSLAGRRTAEIAFHFAANSLDSLSAFLGPLASQPGPAQPNSAWAMRGSTTSGIRSLGGVPGLIGRYLGLQGRKHQIFIGLFICTVATHIFVNRAPPHSQIFFVAGTARNLLTRSLSCPASPDQPNPTEPGLGRPSQACAQASGH